jgi:hypothetical protein
VTGSRPYGRLGIDVPASARWVWLAGIAGALRRWGHGGRVLLACLVRPLWAGDARAAGAPVHPERRHRHRGVVASTRRSQASMRVRPNSDETLRLRGRDTNQPVADRLVGAGLETIAGCQVGLTILGIVLAQFTTHSDNASGLWRCPYRYARPPSSV